MTATRSVKVDLDNDQVYEADLTSDVRSLEWERGRDNEFAVSQTGECALRLRSVSGKYHLGHAAVIAGWQVGRRIQAQATVDGVVYGLFTGRTRSIKPSEASPSVKDAADVLSYDAATFLAAKDITTALALDLPFSHPSAASVVGMVLDAANFSGTLRRLAKTNDHIAYVWFDGVRALGALGEIAEGERGVFFIDGSGFFVYQDRHFRIREARATVSQATFDGVAARSIEADEADIVTEVRVKASPRAVGAQGVVWAITSAISIEAGKTVALFANFTTPVTGVITPVVTTDYTAINPATGADATADIRVAFTAFARAAKIVLTNTGATTRLVNFLRIRATPLLDFNDLSTTDGRSLTAVASAPVSYGGGYCQLGVSRLTPTANANKTKLAGAGETQFTPNTISLEPRLLGNVFVATSLARYVLKRQGVQVPRLEVTLVGVSDAEIKTLLGLEISDRITLSLSNLGTTGDYWVEKISARWPAAAPLSMTLQVTAAFAADFLQLASSPADTNNMRLSPVTGVNVAARLAY